MTGDAAGLGSQGETLGSLVEALSRLRTAILQGDDPSPAVTEIDTVLSAVPDTAAACRGLGEELADDFIWVIGGDEHPWADEQRERAAQALANVALFLFERHPCTELAWGAAAAAETLFLTAESPENFDDVRKLAERALTYATEDWVRGLAHQLVVLTAEAPDETLANADAYLTLTPTDEIDPSVLWWRFVALCQLQRADAAADAGIAWMTMTVEEPDREQSELLADSHAAALGQAIEAELPGRSVVLVDRFLANPCWIPEPFTEDYMRIVAARASLVAHENAAAAEYLDGILDPDGLEPDLAVSFWTYRARLAHTVSDMTTADRAIRRALAVLPGVTLPDVRDEALNEALALAETRGDGVWAHQLTEMLAAGLAPGVAEALRIFHAVMVASRNHGWTDQHLADLERIPALVRGNESEYAPMVVGSSLLAAMGAVGLRQTARARALLSRAQSDLDRCGSHLEPWRVAFARHYLRMTESALLVEADPAAAVAILTEVTQRAESEGVSVLRLSSLLMLGIVQRDRAPAAALEATVAGLEAWRALEQATPASSERDRMRMPRDVMARVVVRAADHLGPRLLAEGLEFVRAVGRPIAGDGALEDSPLAALMAFTDPLAGLNAPGIRSDSIRIAPAVPTRMPWGNVALCAFGATEDLPAEALWIPR